MLKGVNRIDTVGGTNINNLNLNIMNNLKLDTLDVSLCKKYNNGMITLREMAMKLHENGWTNFLDENRAMEIINRYNSNLK